MNYDTVKKLKEAGFPQTGNNRDSAGELINIDGCYIPTLSELIEGCGDEFYSVVYATDNDWRAYTETDQWNISATAGGKTAESAVANLYLALNPLSTGDTNKRLQ